jgi:hypothetical protein
MGNDDVDGVGVGGSISRLTREVSTISSNDWTLRGGYDGLRLEWPEWIPNLRRVARSGMSTNEVRHALYKLFEVKFGEREEPADVPSAKVCIVRSTDLSEFPRPFPASALGAYWRINRTLSLRLIIDNVARIY